jgi:1-acyl-sn-glycerol-3-phosphate acyltransferase
MSEFVYPPVISGIKIAWKYFGLKFKFKGQENIPTSGGAVIAMNHIGYLDFALVGTGVLPRKRYVRFMAKKAIFDNKLVGPFMRGMKHISVDRENGSQSFVAAMRALRAGELVGIFPEATISQSWEIKELKSGAVRLSQGGNVPIIPTVIWGSQRIYTKGHKPNFKRSRFPISVYFGQPYFVNKGEDVEAAEADLKLRLEKLLREVQGEYPDKFEGQWWAPARLGGTARTPEQVKLDSEAKRNGES